jgi:hypothetical protein
LKRASWTRSLLPGLVLAQGVRRHGSTALPKPEYEALEITYTTLFAYNGPYWPLMIGAHDGTLPSLMLDTLRCSRRLKRRSGPTVGYRDTLFPHSPQSFCRGYRASDSPHRSCGSRVDRRVVQLAPVRVVPSTSSEDCVGVLGTPLTSSPCIHPSLARSLAPYFQEY